MTPDVRVTIKVSPKKIILKDRLARIGSFQEAKTAGKIDLESSVP